MQPSPAFTLDIQRFAAWRWTVTAGAAVAGAAQVTWAMTGASHRLVIVLSAALLCTVLLAAVSLLRAIVPLRLHWDGRDWSISPIATDPAAPRRIGRLDVMLDLGAFLLLRFEASAGSFRQRYVWIPVGRSGLEAQWHSLRCAVYCARRSHDGSADTAR